MSRLLRYLLGRLLWAIPVLLGASVVTFMIMQLTPGDPARFILGQRASQEAVMELRRELGLHQPIFVQYVDFVFHAAQGDFGQSLQTREEVTAMLLQRIPYTAQLSIAGLLIAVVVSFPVGVIGAVREGEAADHASRVGALLGISTPNFWLGLLLILVFAVPLEAFPIFGMTLVTEDPIAAVTSTLLPAIALGTAQAALLTRLLRGGMLDEMQEGYVRTARAYGIDNRETTYVYVLKNAVLPTITVIGLQLGALLGGAVIVEQVFGIPGIGRLAIQAIFNKDFPVIQGVTMLVAVTFVAANLLVDVLYAQLDPRIRLGGSER
ncbi:MULTISPECIES: ABC transporter permease [Halolamina]|uniref:Peptide/nickel transport system permease protein n=1 Tax=Halolamina pelagica TaxID=699431 RepID=A0A1I5W9F9_9EURY|nr:MULTISPECIES: ABC transporter permease [Halolamina]NHX37505.1 ABC transporter permease [Halolamina sp. R1-12]SFQ16257.1 peptide/nickel transport system permease protein [Halolamina pelagica]